MGKPSYILKIDKPCNKGWDSMEVRKDGRYCSNCAKKVIDFTNLTDTEVLHLIEQSSGRICGRLATTQLNRNIKGIDFSQKSIAYRFLAGLLVFAGTNMGAKAGSKAKIDTEISLKSNSKNELSIKRGQALNDTTKKILFGVVIDSSTNLPMPGVSIFIKGTRIGIPSDVNGKFELSIPEFISQNDFKLIFASVGFQEKEFDFSVQDLNTFKTIFLVPFAGTLEGDIIIVRRTKWWHFKKKKKLKSHAI